MSKPKQFSICKKCGGKYEPRKRSVHCSFKCRFEDSFKRSDDCWEWQAGLTPSGYGQIRNPDGSYLAHRIAWEMTFGKIHGDHLLVCHKCDNRKCVNPDHLFVGTHADNQDDMAKKGRAGNRKYTREQIIGIRAAVAAGLSKRATARLFRTSDVMVHFIVKRKIHKYVV